jgi:CYTH domain-containing protein
MAHTRRFLVSPALARLIRKEQGTQGRVFEGYFANTLQRTHFVRMNPPHCHLVMVVSGADSQMVEEATELPRSQAQALLDVAHGKIAYECTPLALATGVTAVLEQVLAAQAFDLLSVSFPSAREAEGFQPPVWVGAEVSGEAAYEKAAMALNGEPEVQEPEISNAALDAVLDLLQSRSSSRYRRDMAA